LRKKPQPTAETARKIWLAGIGAYGRAFTEAQETVAKLSSDSSRVFEDLVAKGEAIEQKVEAGRRKMAERMGPAGGAFEERIRKMRERIGFSSDDAAPLEARLAAVEDRLARIEKQLGAGRAKAPVKRTAARKKKS